jgi:hypothetical protein
MSTIAVSCQSCYFSLKGRVVGSLESRLVAARPLAVPTRFTSLFRNCIPIPGMKHISDNLVKDMTKAWSDVLHAKIVMIFGLQTFSSYDTASHTLTRVSSIRVCTYPVLQRRWAYSATVLLLSRLWAHRTTATTQT